jgi:hypothetical protein
MATIVNNPNGGNDNGGWIIAIVVIIVLLLLGFFLFGADRDDVGDDVRDAAQQVENRVETVPVPVGTSNSTTTVNSTTTNP